VLGPRAVSAILLAPFVVLGVDWSLREGGDRLAGLAPAAFATGCICLTVAVRISAFGRGGRAGRWTLVASAIWLAIAATWWIGGQDSPVWMWAIVAYLLLVPGVPVAWALVAITLVRPSWKLVTALAWLCAVVLVPGFVVVIEFWDA
jgi:hypothetical protein